MQLTRQEPAEIVTVDTGYGSYDQYSLPMALVRALHDIPPNDNMLIFKDGNFKWIPLPKTFNDYRLAI